MKAVVFLFAATALAGCTMQNANQGAAPTQPEGASASIPFPRFGGIFNWENEGETGIYIESISRKWYHAIFTFPCRNLPYVQTIGFNSTRGLPLDKFDSIVADHEVCYFQSLTEIPGPPGSVPPPLKGKVLP